MSLPQLLALSHRLPDPHRDPFALKPGERKISPAEAREIINRKRAAKGLPPVETLKSK